MRDGNFRCSIIHTNSQSATVLLCLHSQHISRKSWKHCHGARSLSIQRRQSTGRHGYSDSNGIVRFENTSIFDVQRSVLHICVQIFHHRGIPNKVNLVRIVSRWYNTHLNRRALFDCRETVHKPGLCDVLSRGTAQHHHSQEATHCLHHTVGKENFINRCTKQTGSRMKIAARKMEDNLPAGKLLYHQQVLPSGLQERLLKDVGDFRKFKLLLCARKHTLKSDHSVYGINYFCILMN